MLQNSIFGNMHFQIGPKIAFYAKNIDLYCKMHWSAKAINTTC